MASEWMQKWYYKNYEEIHGPISQFEMKKKFQAEEINGETFIRNLTTLPQWRQIRHVPQLIQWLISVNEFTDTKVVEEPEEKTRKMRKEMRKEEKRKKKVRKKIKLNFKTEMELGMKYSIGADVDIMRQNTWMAGKVVAYDHKTCKYRVQLSEEGRSSKRYPISYPVLVTEMRSPMVVTKNRAVAALCAAATDPSMNSGTTRHLVHIAESVGVNLGNLPNPARLHVVTVVITGDLMNENLIFTLSRDDIIFDVKAKICRRIQIIPVYQKLTLDGERSHIELDDFNSLAEVGFQPNQRYLIRLSTRSNVPNIQRSVRQHHELKVQLERTKTKLQRVREKITKLARESRYNEMMTLVQEGQKMTRDVELLQERIGSVSRVVQQNENQIVEQIEITRRELNDWEEDYQHLKDELKNMLARNEIPGVSGVTPKLYKVWERLRVAKLNMKLLQSATEAKE